MITFSRANFILPVPMGIATVIVSGAAPFSVMLTPAQDAAVSGPKEQV